MKTIRAAGRAWAAAACLAAQAQEPPEPLTDLSLEELMNVPVESVVAASRYEQKVTRAPASVTILTAEDVKKFGWRTPLEALRSVAGLYATNDRAWSFLGLRGFSQAGDYNTGVLLLVDGHRVNDAIYNLGYYAHESVVDVDMIQRLEVIRGPSSSIYGNSAFFGVVNVVTRDAADLAGAEVSVDGGSLESFKGRVSWGRKLGEEKEVVLSASYYGSRGQDELFFPEAVAAGAGDGPVTNADWEGSLHLYGKARMGDLTLTAGYVDRQKDVPTAPYGSALNAGLAWSQDRRGYVDARFETEVTPTGSLAARVSYDWYPYDATWPYENAAPPPAFTINRDRTRSQWLRGEVQWTERIKARHTLILGAEYQENLEQLQQNFDEAPFFSYLDLDHGSSLHAAYAQVEWEVRPDWLLNAGLRYDHYESFGDTVNPRVGMIFQPRETTTVKALYGEAFRAPNDYELNFESSNNERNPNLDPETIRTYEVVLEHYLPPNSRLSAALYRYEAAGLIAQVENPATGRTFFENLEAVNAHGIELQAERHTSAGHLARLSYAWQETEQEGGGELENSPRHLAKLHLSVPVRAERVFASAELLYQGSTLTAGGTRLGDHLLCNVTLLARDAKRGWEASASVYNALDEEYRLLNFQSGSFESVAQNGRTFRVRVTRRF